MIKAYKYLHGEKIYDSSRLFNLSDKSITSSNGWKLSLDKFRLLEYFCQVLVSTLQKGCGKVGKGSEKIYKNETAS